MDSDHLDENMEIIEEGPVPHFETELTEKVKRRRSRVANPDQWLSNIRKRMRASGQAYVNSRGRIKSAREVRPKDCSKCPRKCTEKVSEEERQKIHTAFWGLSDSHKQKLFISTLVEEIPVKHVRTKNEVSRRSATRLYFLRCNKDKKVPVCQGFFLATLDISEAKVRNILKCRDDTSYFIPEDQRGKGPSPRARPEESKNLIREHIRTFVESHAADIPGRIQPTPKKKKRPNAEPELQVVQPGINICKMYTAYLTFCEWNGVQPEKPWLYRHILKNEFNISFMDPNPRKNVPIEGEEEAEEYEAKHEVVEQQVEDEEELEEEHEEHEEVIEPIQVYVHQPHSQVAHEVIIPANTIYINPY